MPDRLAACRANCRSQLATSPLVCLQHALETDPADAQNWHVLAKCLMDFNQYDVAYDCLMYATTLEPANAENWLSVGNLYLQKGQAADAITAYEHAVHLNPMSEAWYELGKVRHSVVYSSSSSIDAQMLSAAIQAYTQALSMCPTKRDDISLKLQHLRALVDSLPTPSDTPAAAAPAEEATRRADALAAPLPPSTVLPPPGTLLSAAPAPGAPAPGLMAESQGGQLTREPAAAAEAMGSTSTSPLAAAETAAVEPPLAVSETSTMAGLSGGLQAWGGKVDTSSMASRIARRRLERTSPQNSGRDERSMALVPA